MRYKSLLDAGIAAERLHVNAPVKTSADKSAINTKLTLDVTTAKTKQAEPVKPVADSPPAIKTE